MKFIIGPIGSGKTARMIHECIATKTILVVAFSEIAIVLKQGYPELEVITFNDTMYKHRQYMIDDIESCLRSTSGAIITKVSIAASMLDDKYHVDTFGDADYDKRSAIYSADATPVEVKQEHALKRLLPAVLVVSIAINIFNLVF